MIYSDGASGTSYAKRFNVTSVTRDKEYDLTKGSEKSKVHHLSVNPNGEAEVVRIVLTPGSSARNKEFDYYFEELEIKGRGSMGNRYQVSYSFCKIQRGWQATLSGRKLWLDDQFGRLNTEEKGTFVGPLARMIRSLHFMGTDHTKSPTRTFQKFDTDKLILIEKFNPEKKYLLFISIKRNYNSMKRFKIETTTLGNKFAFIKEGEGNYLEAVTTQEEPILVVQSGRGSQVRKAKFKIAKTAEVTGWKTVGTKLVDFTKTMTMEWQRSREEKQGELFE